MGRVRFLVATLLLITTVLSCTDNANKPLSVTQNINSNWLFKQADKQEWMPATVPGCVHTDLIRNKIIEDPFYRLNEHDVQWVDKKDWIYTTYINITAEQLQKDRIAITFEGLDTYTDVFLNERKIVSSDNMFRAWTKEVKKYLKKGTNKLKIHFYSPINKGLAIYDSYPYEVHSSANDLAEIGDVEGAKRVSPLIRKAQYHFGWDWGPRLVTSGIWKPITLRAWDDAKINDLHIIQQKVDNEEALLTAEFDIDAEHNSEALIEILVDEDVLFSNKIKTQKGTQQYTVDFILPHPKLWWSNGLGEAHLYKITGKIITAKGSDEISHNIGIRTLELLRERDKYGTSFTFVLNKHKVFIKGANYIPADIFLDRVTPEKYEHIISTAKQCNHNMLRVWGGGIYEKDIFYDLCDKYGILVWQDFMFACNMYPGDKDFLSNVQQEAEYNIKRLRNHPCLAIWCGNNEVLAAWKRWGWEQEVREKNPKAAELQWQAYKDIFLDILPTAVSKYDGQRYYWASSPQSGDTIPVDFNNGDDHYWGVWWGKEPFKNYHTKLSRFMSEYGFQSFPEYKTVKKYTNEHDWDIYSEVMQSHQRSSIGNATIELYMLREYKKPKDFESYLYLSQVLQADGIRQAMEGHRIAMPYNMGSLYWQINDCWPVASWSSSDYYGNWKAQQYFSKKAFKEVLIAPRLEGDTLFTYIVSDRLSSFRSKIALSLIDFEGNILWKKDIDTLIESNTSTNIFGIVKDTLLKNYDSRKTVFVSSISDDNEIISENRFYFHPVKELDITKPHITSTIIKHDSTYQISLTTDILAKNVYLSYNDISGFFSDNYFDILAGDTLTVTFLPDKAINTLPKQLKITTIYDSYDK